MAEAQRNRLTTDDQLQSVESNLERIRHTICPDDETLLDVRHSTYAVKHSITLGGSAAEDNDGAQEDGQGHDSDDSCNDDASSVSQGSSRRKKHNKNVVSEPKEPVQIDLFSRLVRIEENLSLSDLEVRK